MEDETGLAETARRHWPQPGERRAFAGVALLLVVSAAVQGIGDVLSTAALATSSGLRGVIALWAADAAIALTGITLFAPWLQRIRPRQLAAALLIGFGAAIALIWAATRGGGAAPGWWMALGIVNTLQGNLVVLAAWTLARDTFAESQAIRLFGPLNGLAYVGTLVGTGWVALAAGSTGAAWLLPACVVMFGASAVVLPLLSQPVTHVAAPQEQVVPAKLWQIPVVRWLGMLELSNGVTWTAMSLAVLAVLQLEPGGPDALQRSYGELKFFGPLLQSLMQITLAGPLLRRLGYGRVLLSTPVALLLGLLGLALMPGLAAAWLATALLQVAFGAEGAASQATLMVAPASMRAAAGAWVTGQLPQVGYLLGCAGLAIGEWAAAALAIQAADSGRWMAAAGLAMALGGIVVWRRLQLALRADAVSDCAV